MCIYIQFMHACYFKTEPVGSKSPTFSTDVKFSGITRNQGQNFALLCQAQAFPVPLFRLVYQWKCVFCFSFIFNGLKIPKITIPIFTYKNVHITYFIIPNSIMVIIRTSWWQRSNFSQRYKTLLDWTSISTATRFILSSSGISRPIIQVIAFSNVYLKKKLNFRTYKCQSSQFFIGI